MLSKFKNSIGTNLINFKGWSTKKRIVVFESDDWGSIRLPDKLLYDEYKKIFPNYYTSPYLRYDSLASENDLSNLFSLLSRFKDKNGNHPIFTFNVVMTNPDFEKIKQSDFNEYHNESFVKTLKRFSQHSKSFGLWEKAMKEKLMTPQFHGREHVNAPLWLNSLKEKKSNAAKAFQFGTWSTPCSILDGINLQASLDWKGVQPLDYQKTFLSEGLQEFKNIFGFSSETMIPNNFVFDSNLYETLLQNDVKCLQGMKYQKLSLGASKGNKRLLIRRHVGDINESGLIYLVRNCSFEPSQTNKNFNDVESCFESIKNAFFWNKPAIIDTHRLNYIGVYNEKKRDENLKKLEILIQRTLNKWEDVVFMSSNQLLNEIVKNNE